MNGKSLETLVKDMFKILDRIESNDDGTREFYTTSLSSCRTMDCIRAGEIFQQMRDAVGLGPRPVPRSYQEIRGVKMCSTCKGTGDLSNHERETNECYDCFGTGDEHKPCPSCFGAGQIKEDGTPTYHTCHDCSGDGLVPV